MRDLRLLPKAHLHVHLESTLRPATLRELAAAADVDVPAPAVPYEGFAGFAARGSLVRQCLRRPADFHRVARELVEDEAQQGTRWVEVTFTAAAHEERLAHREAPLEAVLAGLAEGGAASGVGWAVVLDHSRRRPVDLAHRTLDLATRYADHGVVGLGLAGDESHPLAPFAGICAAAADRGLKLVQHAGETAGPASIREALDLGRADRIGHGIRALGDADLVAELRDRRVPLEVCPSSNVALGLVPSAAEHPFPAMLAAGLQVTLNTDVPDVTGAGLAEEYQRARAAFGLDDRSLTAVARTAVLASCAPPEVQQGILAGQQAWLDDPR